MDADYPANGVNIARRSTYSRKDLSVAECLRDALIEAAFEAYLDLHDILPGEPWQERIGKLIETADTTVFALSPNSIASEIVDWEVNEAERLGKRILPVVVHDFAPDQVPGRIKRFNYIFMRKSSEWASGLATLCDALRSDFAWIRQHTRVGELTADWERGMHASEFLLRGTALQAAESWISDRPPAGPHLTPLQIEYIKVSRAEAVAQAVRLGRTQVLFGIPIVAIISSVGYLCWITRDYLEFQMRLLLDAYWPTELSASAEHRLGAGDKFRECASCPQMIVVPAGDFLMGSPSDEAESSEHPQRRVTIERSFAVSKCPSGKMLSRGNRL